MNNDNTMFHGGSSSFLNAHWQALNARAEQTDQLQAQVAALVAVVRSLAQETVVLKALLLQSPQVSSDEYRQQRVQRIIDDHSSLGLDPELSHSLYQHTLDESAFMSQVLGLRDADLAEANRKIREAETMS